MKRVKTNDTPFTNAFVFVSVCLGFNIVTITAFLAYIFGLEIAMGKNTVIYVGIGLALILYIINYFLLYSKRKLIVNKFEKFTQKRKTIGLIYWGLYVILTFVIFALVIKNFVTPKY